AFDCKDIQISDFFHVTPLNLQTSVPPTFRLFPLLLPGIFSAHHPYTAPLLSGKDCSASATFLLPWPYGQGLPLHKTSYAYTPKPLQLYLSRHTCPRR